jgi:hypothetical protein
MDKLEEKQKKLNLERHLVVKNFEKKITSPFLDIWNTQHPIQGEIVFSFDKKTKPFICRGYGKEEIPLPSIFEKSITSNDFKLPLSEDIYKIRCFADSTTEIKYSLIINKISFSNQEFPNIEFQKAIKLKNKYVKLKKDLLKHKYSPELNQFLKENNLFHQDVFKIRAKDDFKPFAVLHRDEQLIIKHVKGKVHKQYVNTNTYGPNGKRKFKPSRRMLVEKLPPFSLICGTLTQSERFDQVYFYGKGPHHLELKSNTSIFCNINRRLDKDYFLAGEFEFLYQIIPESVKTIIQSTLARLDNEIVPLKNKKQKLIETYINNLK